MNEAVTVMQSIDIEGLDNGETSLRIAMIFTIVYEGLILIPTFFILCMAIKCRRHCCLKLMVIITLLLEFGIALTCMIMALSSASQYEDRAN